jgi:hypothetical protein
MGVALGIAGALVCVGFGVGKASGDNKELHDIKTNDISPVSRTRRFMSSSYF